MQELKAAGGRGAHTPSLSGAASGRSHDDQVPAHHPAAHTSGSGVMGVEDGCRH